MLIIIYTIHLYTILPSPDLTRLEIEADWPNIDMAVIVTLYGRRLFGGRPVKIAVPDVPVKCIALQLIDGYSTG